MKTFSNLWAFRLPAPPPGDHPAGTPVCRWRGQTFVKAADEIPSSGERAAFEAVGWVFAVPSGEPEKEELPEPVAVGRPVIGDDDQLQIDTGRLVVKLQPGLSEQDAIRVLQRHRLAVRRRLKFAPNLFEVDAEQDAAAADLAQEAAADADFVYAQPQMIKQIGGR